MGYPKGIPPPPPEGGGGVAITVPSWLARFVLRRYLVILIYKHEALIAFP